VGDLGSRSPTFVRFSTSTGRIAMTHRRCFAHLQQRCANRDGLRGSKRHPGRAKPGDLGSRSPTFVRVVVGLVSLAGNRVDNASALDGRALSERESRQLQPLPRLLGESRVLCEPRGWVSFDLYFLGDAATVTRARLREFFGGRSGYALLDDAVLYDSEDTGVSFSFTFEELMTESDGGRPVVPVALHVSTLGPSPFGLEAAEETEAFVTALGVEVWDPQSGAEGPFEAGAFLRSWRSESRKAHDEAAAKEMDFTAHPHMSDSVVKNVWQWNRGHELLAASFGRQADGVHVPAILCVKDPGGTPRAVTAVEWKDAAPIALPEVDVVMLESALGAKSYIEWADLDPLIAEWSEEPPQSRYAFGDNARTAGVAHHVLTGDGLREAFGQAISKARDEELDVLQWEQLVVGEFLARSVVRIAVGEIAEGTKRPDFYAELVVEDWNGTHAARLDGRGAVRRGAGDDIEAPASIVRQARLMDLVRVAGALLDTGFPDLDVGKLALGARGATVRVRVGAMGHVSEVAVTADVLGDMPALQQLAGTLGGVLGDALPAWPPTEKAPEEARPAEPEPVAPEPVVEEPVAPEPVVEEPVAPEPVVEEATREEPVEEEPEPPTIAQPSIEPEPATIAQPMLLAPPSPVPISEETTPEEEPPAMTLRRGTPAVVDKDLPPIRLTYHAGSEYDATFGFGRTILELLDDGRVRIHNIDLAHRMRPWEAQIESGMLEALRDVVRRAAATVATHVELVASPGNPLRHVDLWLGDQSATVRATWNTPMPHDELFRWLDSIVAQACAPESLGYASSVPGLVSSASASPHLV